MKKDINEYLSGRQRIIVLGCSDFLDRESYGRDTSWKTDEDVMKAVYALYYFVSPNWSEQICGRGHMWFECASDNILIGRDRPAVDEIREFRMSPSNDQDVQEVWGVMYQNVAKANNIIKLVPDLGITPVGEEAGPRIRLFLPRLLDALDGSLLRRRYERRHSHHPRHDAHGRHGLAASGPRAEELRPDHPGLPRRGRGACPTSRSSPPTSTACRTKPPHGLSPPAPRSMPRNTTSRTTTS